MKNTIRKIIDVTQCIQNKETVMELKFKDLLLNRNNMF